MSQHVVLGASGAIGRATIDALRSRDYECLPLDRQDVDVRDTKLLAEKMRDAEFVYLCVGLPYNRRVWAKQFPEIMASVLAACETVHAKLIYFDNCYMYGPSPLQVPFDELHRQDPCSAKGAARKVTTDLALAAHKAGRVKVVVGRSADFYGSGATNSPFYIKFLANMLQGRAPQVVMPEGPRHTYAYTGDCGRALVELATQEDTYGDVWHLPVGPAVTVSEMMALFNGALGSDFQAVHLSGTLLTFLSLFSDLLREVKEMNYQYEGDYIMSDAKFRRRFPDFQSTDYEEGVQAMVTYFQELSKASG